MKNFNLIATLILCLFMGFSLTAQEEEKEAKSKSGFFVKVNVGYGFSAIPTVQGNDYNMASDGTSLSSIGRIYGTAAPGVYPGIGIGYMINDYIGFQLAFDYSFGRSKVQEVTFEDLPAGLTIAGQEFNLLNAYIVQERTFRTKQVRLMPSVIVKGGDKKIAPYARFGVVLPLAGSTITDVNATLTSSEVGLPDVIAGFLPFDLDGVSLGGNVVGKAETKGQFSIGFDAALGMEYQVTDLISIFGELQATALTIKSKQTKVSQYDGTYQLENSPVTLDELFNAVGLLGIDLDLTTLGLYQNIDEVPLSEKEINYVDELNSSTNSPFFPDSFDENRASDELGRRENYSSIGINLGIKFNF